MNKIVMVKDARQIMTLGGMRGPIGPFTTDTRTIYKLISEGCTVFEHLKNGEEVKLSYANFDRDLNEELGVNAELEEKNKVVPIAVESIKTEAEAIKVENTVIEEETNAVKTSIIDVCEDA